MSDVEQASLTFEPNPDIVDAINRHNLNTLKAVRNTRCGDTYTKICIDQYIVALEALLAHNKP